MLLLLDDLEAAINLVFEARQALRWLFLRGLARRVWPIVTLNADRSVNLPMAGGVPHAHLRLDQGWTSRR
ncbi:MAG: hypothetical protein U0X87_08165 [Anaerolineales bacterium]